MPANKTKYYLHLFDTVPPDEKVSPVCPDKFHLIPLKCTESARILGFSYTFFECLLPFSSCMLLQPGRPQSNKGNMRPSQISYSKKICCNYIDLNSPGHPFCVLLIQQAVPVITDTDHCPNLPAVFSGYILLPP